MHDPVHIRFTPRQLSRIRAGHPVQIPHKHIGHPHGHVFQNLHPTNLRKLHKAHRAGKGIRLQFHPSELEGTGILDVFKKVGNFISENKAILKPIASAALDVGSKIFPQAAPYREAFRGLTGVGVAPRTKKQGSVTKGSAAAKARMARVRAAKGAGFKDFARKVGHAASNAYNFGKKSGLLTKGADFLEQTAAQRFPKYAEEAHLARGQVRKHLDRKSVV